MKKVVNVYVLLFIAMAFCSCGGHHPQTSSGYIDKDDYTPTIDEDEIGEYHTIDGSMNQIQYQGSREQQSDLDAIDEYARTHPNF